MKKNKKNLILMLLMLIVCGMGIGYSILSRELKIEGTATIDPNFDVAITAIKDGNFNYAYYGTYKCVGCDEKNIGVVTQNTEPSFTATTANFDVTLGVNATTSYIVKIENTGSLDAEISDVIISKTGATNVKLNTPRDVKGFVIKPGDFLEYIIELSYDASSEVNELELTSNVSIIFDIKQKISDAETLNKPFIYFGAIVHNEDSITSPMNAMEIFTLGVDTSYESNLYVSINGSEYEIYDTKTIEATSFDFYFGHQDLIEGKNIVKLKLEQNGVYSNEITLEYHKPVI